MTWLLKCTCYDLVPNNVTNCPLHGIEALLSRAEEMKSAWDTQENGEHYRSAAIQPSEFIVKNHIPWLEGNAIKYLCRHSAKNKEIDLKKAIHYAQLALEHYYGLKSEIKYAAQE